MRQYLCALLFVCFAMQSLPQAAENKLFIEAQTVKPSETGVAVPILLDNKQDLYGFQLSIVTDPKGVVKITGLNLDGTAFADVGTPTGGGFSDGRVLDNGERITWGVVLDISEPFDVNKVIPVGTAILIGNVTLDVLATEAATAALKFQDVPSPNPATMGKAKNVLADTSGDPVVPTTSDGVITVEADEQPKFVRGNSNSDANVDISDAVFTLNFLFLGGTDPKCMDAADSDDKTGLNITDGIYLLTFLFQGGPPPPPPYPDLGTDPTPEDPELGCIEGTS